MIKLRSLDYKMNEILSRLNQGKTYGYDLKPYGEKVLKRALKFFEENEEYEKCQLLIKYIENRFNHEKNYLINS